MPEFREVGSIFCDFGAGCEISLDGSQKLFKTSGKSIIHFFVPGFPCKSRHGLD